MQKYYDNFGQHHKPRSHIIICFTVMQLWGYYAKGKVWGAYILVQTPSPQTGFPSFSHHPDESIQSPTTKIPPILLSNILHLVHSPNLHTQSLGFPKTPHCWNLGVVYVMCHARCSSRWSEDSCPLLCWDWRTLNLLLVSTLLAAHCQKWQIFATLEVTKELQSLLGGRILRLF